MNIVPDFDYLVCEEVKDATGVVTTTDVADHWQKFRVLAAGPGRVMDGVFVAVETKVGDVIYVQKHAEADTPDDLRARGLYLIMNSRKMSTEKESSK